MTKEKPTILIIYTGGTIGMIKNVVTDQLISFNFDQIMEHVPEINRLNVNIETISFSNPMDSSEMQPSDWVKIAEMIGANYDCFDGFVVLHGSDTMAYTASALSFMLEGLRKPVIITGSQLPIGTLRTDGKENLITAIEIAGAHDENGVPVVQEVAIYFEYSLYRGNRSTKDSATHFEAFRSPNYQELAVAGVEINYNMDRMYRSPASDFSIRTEVSTRVVLLKWFPGLDLSLYRDFFNKEKIDGILLETFGAGNAPISELFERMAESFIQAGGVILNITQCSSGSVKQGLYETSAGFERLGVISGADMTTEAAITKLMVVLGSFPKEQVAEVLRTNLRGERTF